MRLLNKTVEVGLFCSGYSLVMSPAEDPIDPPNALHCFCCVFSGEHCLTSSNGGEGSALAMRILKTVASWGLPVVKVFATRGIAVPAARALSDNLQLPSSRYSKAVHPLTYPHTRCSADRPGFIGGDVLTGGTALAVNPFAGRGRWAQIFFDADSVVVGVVAVQ